MFSCGRRRSGGEADQLAFARGCVREGQLGGRVRGRCMRSTRHTHSALRPWEAECGRWRFRDDVCVHICTQPSSSLSAARRKTQDTTRTTHHKPRAQMPLQPQALPHPNRRKYSIRVRSGVRESGGDGVDTEIELSGATLRVAVGMGAVDGALSERVVRETFRFRARGRGRRA